MSILFAKILFELSHDTFFIQYYEIDHEKHQELMNLDFSWTHHICYYRLMDSIKYNNINYTDFNHNQSCISCNYKLNKIYRFYLYG